MPAPQITITRGNRTYRYLWLKYVTGIDLTQHCARSLHGRYSQQVNQDLTEAAITLDEFPTPICWYLCGVTTDPSRWGENPHLAFEVAPGHVQDLEVQHLTVTLTGARPITGWGTNSVPADAAHANERDYASCRNWQFAHHLHTSGVPSIPGHRPRGLGQGIVAGQLPLS
ncbi:hypothetical protein JIX56_20060 [Streptomyces sp. CA-210063]|uniref:hypothetical protein n=1 Tax=Streptomyces sp. CA-210063 TaxID=2801029 RepID=UPI00214C92EB|nr:hypothetical protein [Streptomyces sp. CA-210063]UUU32015.1 hypothetical protein JIX56_20060 [Streptomyces sp. CA-210063]